MGAKYIVQFNSPTPDNADNWVVVPFLVSGTDDLDKAVQSVEDFRKTQEEHMRSRGRSEEYIAKKMEEKRSTPDYRFRILGPSPEHRFETRPVVWTEAEGFTSQFKSAGLSEDEIRSKLDDRARALYKSYEDLDRARIQRLEERGGRWDDKQDKVDVNMRRWITRKFNAVSNYLRSVGVADGQEQITALRILQEEYEASN
jgi:hypothetical protein